MTDKVKNLVITASVLATAMIFALIQIPILGLGLDVSFVAILLGRRYIGYGYSILICLFYPWVSIGFMGPIGVFFMLLQSIGVLTLDYWFNKNNYSLFGIIMVVLLGTLWSVTVNFFIITPMYFYLAGETSGNLFGNFTDLSDEFLKFQFTWLITGTIFNPIKLSLIYGITFGIWIGLENSVNLEPNNISDNNTEIKQMTNISKKEEKENLENEEKLENK